MSDVFFIADTHFGHRNIVKYRTQFKSLEDHDNTIIDNWNSVIKKKKDIVWVLGDMFFTCKDEYIDVVMERLNGTIRIIRGNHDCIPNKYAELFQNGLCKKYKFWLSHAPIHVNSLRAIKNIHGHVHAKTINDDNYINVSCENINYTPISLSYLRKE